MKASRPTAGRHRLIAYCGFQGFGRSETPGGHLASIFAIDICGFAVMSNHLHLIVCTCPNLVEGCSDEEIALRWSRLAPARDIATGEAIEPSESDLQYDLIGFPSGSSSCGGGWRVCRGCWLVCASRFAKANREDGCDGRFWQGRFRSQRLLDEEFIWLAASTSTSISSGFLTPVMAAGLIIPAFCQSSTARSTAIRQMAAAGRDR